MNVCSLEDDGVQLRIEQRTFKTTSNRKIDINVVQSNYHIEITPSWVWLSFSWSGERAKKGERKTDEEEKTLISRRDAGNYDRQIVQELLKDIAQTQQVDLNARKRFKGLFKPSAFLLFRRDSLILISSCFP